MSRPEMIENSPFEASTDSYVYTEAMQSEDRRQRENWHHEEEFKNIDDEFFIDYRWEVYLKHITGECPIKEDLVVEIKNRFEEIDPYIIPTLDTYAPLYSRAKVDNEEVKLSYDIEWDKHIYMLLKFIVICRYQLVLKILGFDCYDYYANEYFKVAIQLRNIKNDYDGEFIKYMSESF